MKAQLRRYALFALVVVADLLLYLQHPARGEQAIRSALDYLVEMLLFIPPIFVLVGLLDVWVPRQIVEKNVGPDSGVRGVIISILVATAAAGPLYAGFPVADALLRKGCRLANAVIFLGTWATIKIPMLMMEVKFVGLPFALLRLALTLPAIIATGYLMEMILKVGETGRFAQDAGENKCSVKPL
ncbi:permease [Desulfofundulus thermosubterraneus]|uniref:Predicted permease n=1 Tax=Desulfofundulus thermosubterraneus DSM 16057 TaxID=1121432 RepID=A0A1M6IQ61_9FIRM|nr:permease [Desulfofundulus thermosubterraneus]SHJ36574.1 Predicted permease [Desulfofundulus thermosubterraneus DSM 16057]